MTVTTLDPHTALVVIDLQKGIAALPLAAPIADVADKAASLADAFRRRGLPVVLVVVAGAPSGRNEMPPRASAFPDDWTELLPALNARPDDHVVTKRTWGAFTDTGLEALLKSKGVTQIVLAGVATSIGVESTAREAHSLGFNVTLAVDAMTDLRADAHAGSIERVFPRLGESGTTGDILALLDRQDA